MDTDKINKLEAINFKWKRDFVKDRWNIKFEELKDFVKEYGHANPIISSHSIGSWINKQRNDYRLNKLDESKINKLSSLKGWIWDAREHEWDKNLTKLREFILTNGNSFISKDSGSLGTWVYTNRKNYKLNKLSPERIKKLNSIKLWTWENK